MAVYVMADLHLSQSVDKAMDVFKGWEGYTQRIIDNWTSIVMPSDTIVLAGDISWGMTMEEAMADFKLIDSLAGRKIIVKGNHDYWWGSVTSMHRAFSENKITTIDFLHNNSYLVEDKYLCGSRGWLFEKGEELDAKVIRREAIRIEASLKSATEKNAEKVMFMHYPPLYTGQIIEQFIEIMQEYGVKRCYYGHIHGAGHSFAQTGEHYGIDFTLTSADYLGFKPELVE